MMHTNEALFIAGATGSAAFSFSVVLTGLVFPKIILSAQHPFSNIIWLISLSDMIASISFCFGFPTQGTHLCEAQSILMLFFFPASWLWTVALVFQLYSMSVYRRLCIRMFPLHCIVWSVSLLVLTLPLIENRYGNDDELSGHVICTLNGRQQRNHLEWMLGIFNGVLGLCVAFMVAILVHVWLHFASREEDSARDWREIALFRSMRLYPLALTLTRAPVFVAFLVLAVTGDMPIGYLQGFEAIATQYGTVLAIIFFSNSQLVRTKWWELVFPRDPNKDKHSSFVSDNSTFVSDAIDIEGDAFSSEDSIVGLPSFSNFVSDIRSSLGTIELQSRTTSGDSTGTNRVSFLVRDWLVSRPLAHPHPQESSVQSPITHSLPQMPLTSYDIRVDKKPDIDSRTTSVEML
ncbi:hypothetical protein B484DRAFT_72155 [Ochromonadaceae sp. CCMP2298]|nr:hypothetical protein B484DRAFT_72155 [Ochromonadaceae sp. CCMP2298]